MDVSLKPHTVTKKNGKTLTYNQQVVVVDGRHAGFVGPSHVVNLVYDKYSDDDRKVIEQKVSELLGVGVTSDAPKPVQAPQELEPNVDDFDT